MSPSIPELRPYQSRALTAIRERFERGARAIAAVSPTGSGKTVLIAEIARRSVARRGRVLVVVHRRELARQTVRQLRRHGLEEIRVILGGNAVGPASAPVVVAAIQTLTGKRWRDRLPPSSLVLWDECFSAGTFVGARPIETIQVGDDVPSFNHQTKMLELRRVLAVSRRRPQAMVRVEAGHGFELTCTAEHPVFSAGRYRPARKLKAGAPLHGARVAAWRESGRRTSSGRPLFEPARYELPALCHVVRVRKLRCTDDGTFGGACPDGYVYNLQVEGNENYFVNGLLVHNCHHIKAPSFLTVRDAYANAHHIGFTATPERADRSPLGDVFDEMEVVAETAQLIDEGYLVPCDVWAPAGGRKALAADPVDAYLAHGRGKRGIVFSTSVLHARDVAERLAQAGVSSAHVDGSMPTRERDAALARFASGATQVITNCNLITEGFDVPAAKCIVLARGCDSVAMYLQAVGRALRPEPGESRALLLDLRGAVHRHGLPDAKRVFSLEGEPIRQLDELDPIMQCRECGAVFRVGSRCPNCGALTPPPKLPLVQPEELLQIARTHSVEQRRARYQQLCALAAARGYKPGWAYYRFVGQYGHPPQEVA